ncbi:MAG: cytochrome c3 family protein [Deltaproteobacteria bacterium]|nr:cytochrome c3 family protein [Deltaproteobacteria bacterium]
MFLLGLAAAAGAAPAAPAKNAAPAKAASAADKPAKPKANAGVKPTRRAPLAPLPPGPDVAWSHAPFEVGQCNICHKSGDPKAPGPVVDNSNDMCFTCHEEIKEALAGRKFQHDAIDAGCTACHNPHNSRYKKLLTDPAPQLCYECHSDIEKVATTSKVRHGAITKERACLACHNPHAANVEHLLIQLPYDLCVGCHSTNDLADDNGKKLMNIKQLLTDNEVKHGPIAQKDCSACHQTHGSANFRLLVQAYPEKFYSPYDPANYALCYRCHNDQIMANATTTTLTKFRDGDRSLHYLHVHKEDRGRTCRACHEVHASHKPHQIRDAVPFGSGGWMLPLNFKQTATGGQCEKTCHNTKTYANKK